MTTTRRRALVWPLALAVSWSSVTPLEASAAPPEPDAETKAKTLGTMHVELRARGLTPKLTHELAKWIDAELDPHVTTLRFALEPTPAADVVVQIEISQPQSDVRLYVIQSVAVIDGEIAVRGEVQSCVECNAAELMIRGLELLPDAANAWLAFRREAANAKREPEPPPTPPAPEVEPPRERLLGTRGYVGIAVSGLGIGSCIAGGALLAHSSGHDPTSIDYRPPGWALLAVGLAAVVGGNLLIASDIYSSRHRHRRSAVAVTSIEPHIFDAPGISVRGRF